MTPMQIVRLFVLMPLACGILFWMAWPPHTFVLPVFAGFVPLMLADRELTDRFQGRAAWRVWLVAFIGFMLWNLLTTWWVSNASLWGGIFAIVANAILMTVPWILSRRIRMRFGKITGYVALAAFWMAFEYIHLRWEFTWPWLSLGNAFAAKYTWVQWYSVTGVFGGTFWILLMNVLIYECITHVARIAAAGPPPRARKKVYSVGLAIVLIGSMPILVSLQMYHRYRDRGEVTDVAVLQPNFDPYYEKFIIPYKEQMDKMLSLSLSAISDSTDFLLWPETSIQTDIWLDRIKTSRPVRDIRMAIDSFPDLVCVIGINGYEEYDSKKTATTRIIPPGNSGAMRADTIFFDVYNTALAMNSKGPIGYYHKSKLVPGVERMPYPEQLEWLNRLTIDLGGISGSLGIQKERTVFFNENGIGVAPVICYESVFGEYVSDYINKGAGIICIITNDGWWGDTDGYKQHCMYASLRAIENRRSVARSANTGISCFINQRGDISQATGWREDAVLSAQVPANAHITFYTRHGDYIGKGALWISGILLVIHLIYFFKRRKRPILTEQ